MPDRFLIAPLDKGWQNDLKPWLIPDAAFPELRNAFCYYGRIKKRFGATVMNTSVDESVQQLYSRLRANIGTTAAVTGNITVTVPGTRFKVGQQFSVGTTIFTVTTTGTPAALLSTGTATATFDTTTGQLIITGNNENPSTAVYYYPADPVMGLTNYENSAINFESTYAFDQQFAYYYTSGAWERLGTGASATWTGSDSDFFWAENYRGTAAYNTYLFVTNYSATDRIRYWDGSAWNTLSGSAIQYDSNANNQIITSRLIISFKDRLLLINTIESINNNINDLHVFANRLRYCQVGDPVQSTAGAQAWREDVGGKGGYIDAPLKQAAISARIIKDRLIVYFERATYEVVYTGNQELPFRWQEINSELGVESTFSTVSFDRAIVGVGNTGIHSCNGGYVERIDNKIQNEVFKILNSGDGVKRVYGIRDYYTQTVYWAFPSAIAANNFPQRVLVFNYDNNTWAIYDDSITAFGYYQPTTSIQWQTADYTYATATNPWATGTLQAQFPHVIAGNQQGFTFICEQDFARNAPAMQITNMSVAAGVVTLSVVDHNLFPGEVIAIEQAQGITALNDTFYQVEVVDADTIRVNEPSATGTYTGGGVITRVSQVDFSTKMLNFYMSSAYNAAITKVECFIEKTTAGALTVDASINNSQYPITSMTLSTAANTTLSPFESYQDTVWHPLYPQLEGNLVQLRFYYSDEQLLDSSIAWSDVQLHALLFYSRATSSRLQ